MNKSLLDLYSDYLIVTDRYATATGLSSILEGKISHDKITRFLHEETYDSKALWKIVKPKVREIENDRGPLWWMTHYRRSPIQKRPNSSVGIGITAKAVTSKGST